MNPRIEWETLEYHHTQKNSDWYWAFGIIFITAVVVAFIFNQIIFGIFLLVSGIALGVLSWTSPKIVYFAITDKGIVVGDNLYPYENLESYWVEDLKDIEHVHPSIKSHILLRTKKMFAHTVVIPIHEELQISDVKEHLNMYLPEVKITQPLHVKLMERLGF